jgi:hypothetical protein
MALAKPYLLGLKMDVETHAHISTYFQTHSFSDYASVNVISYSQKTAFVGTSSPSFIAIASFIC